MQIRSMTTPLVAAATVGAFALTGCGSSGGGSTAGQTQTSAATSTSSSAQAGGLGSSSSSAGGLGGGSASSGGGNGTVTIGFQGPLSGAYAQLGINEVDGVQVAIANANKDSSLGFTVKLAKSDDQGTSDQAPPAATQLIQDPSVLGVVGPSFSGATEAVGHQYSNAGLAFVTPSASNATLQQQGYTTFHRIIPNDNVEGSQAADWLARKGVKKLYVLQDLSAYGKGVGDTVAKEAKAKGITVTEQGQAPTKNYAPIAEQIKNSGADALFYAGYDADAALLAKALQSAGFKGLEIGGNGIKSTVFTQNSGAAGYGWYFSCGCQDATVAPAAKKFAAEYQQMFHTPPSTYSPEAYDAANVLIQAIKSAGGASATRSSVESALSKIDYKGITTEIKFQKNGEVQSNALTVNLYRDEKGKIVELGNMKTQK